MIGIRIAVVLALAGAAAAQEIPRVRFTSGWRAWPSNQNNLLMFMDSVELWVNAEVSPPVGTQVSYTPPPGSGTGTIAGLALIEFRVDACDGMPGSWTLTGPGFHGTTGTSFGIRQGWFGLVGEPQASGSVVNCQVGQFVPPGSTANPLNPVNEIWRGRWAYQFFDAGRWLRFTVTPVSASVYVQYGTAGGVPQYAVVPAVVDAGAPVEIFFDTGAPPPCYVFVNDPPDDASVAEGDAASFSVFAVQVPGNCFPIAYRWRKDCVQLNDGGNISGATTSTLTVSPVAPADAGRYDVLVGSGVHSHSARLTVACYANCDASTAAPVLNVADFACFLQRFAAGAGYANCDRSTTPPVLNVADFTCYLQRYAAGCP